jgi:hypothetical protein
MQEALKRKLAEQSTQESDALVYISLKGKKFRIGDIKLPDLFDCVIAEFAFEKTYYSSAYNPDKAASPDCYAISFNEPAAPHELAENPQSDRCSTCKWNEFGSAAVGKGRACKDGRRLILYAYGANGADFTQTAQLKVPAASLKAWGQYCSMVRRQYGLPVAWVITTISMDEDSDYPSLKFNCKGPVTNPAEIDEIGFRDAGNKLLVMRPFKKAEDVASKPEASPARKSKMS